MLKFKSSTPSISFILYFGIDNIFSFLIFEVVDFCCSLRQKRLIKLNSKIRFYIKKT